MDRGASPSPSPAPPLPPSKTKRWYQSTKEAEAREFSDFFPGNLMVYSVLQLISSREDKQEDTSPRFNPSEDDN